MSIQTPSTEVRKQIALQCQHIAALVRLHALNHLRLKSFILQRRDESAAMIKIDMGEGQQSQVVPIETALRQLDQLATLANFPSLMRDRSVLSENMIIPTWAHKAFRDFDWVAPRLTEWCRGGYESFHHASDVLPENEVVRRATLAKDLQHRVMIPAKHFLLRTAGTFTVNAVGRDVKLDTFLCCETSNGLEINPIPRVDEDLAYLVDEKKIRSLIQRRKSSDDQESVNQDIETEIRKIETAYGNWQPGIRVLLKGRQVYDGFGVRLHGGDRQVGHIAASPQVTNMTINEIGQCATSIARICINEFNQLMKAIEAIEYARHERPRSKREQMHGSLRRAALAVFEPDSHFLIGAPRYLSVANRQGVVRKAGKSGRASPFPHPRYLAEYTRLDGSVRPDQFRVPVNGWTPEEHGHPAGHLAVIKL